MRKTQFTISNVETVINKRATEFYKKVVDQNLYSVEDFSQEIWVTLLSSYNAGSFNDITSATIDTLNRLNNQNS